MLRVFTDYHYSALTFNNFALFADRFYGSSYFHFKSSSIFIFCAIEYLKSLYGIEFTFEDVEFINELDKKTQKNLWKSSKTGLTKLSRCAKLSKSPAERRRQIEPWKLNNITLESMYNIRNKPLRFFEFPASNDARENINLQFNASDLESLDDINLISWYTIN